MQVINKTYVNRCLSQFPIYSSFRLRFSRNRMMAEAISVFRNSRPWPLPELASCVPKLYISEFTFIDFLCFSASISRRVSGNTESRTRSSMHERSWKHFQWYARYLTLSWLHIQYVQICAKPKNCYNWQDFFRLI